MTDTPAAAGPHCDDPHDHSGHDHPPTGADLVRDLVKGLSIQALLIPALGVVLLVMPELSLGFACLLIGGAVLVYGVVRLVAYLRGGENADKLDLVLGILLISAIAGVITHIPAGLGVLEAIFIALLQHLMPASAILAALIGYRALYFLLPLGVACVLYLVIERRAGARLKAAH